MTRIAGAILVAALFATPLIVHLAVLLAWPDGIIRAIVGVQLAALMTAALARAGGRIVWLKGLVAAAAAAALVAGLGRYGSTIASGLPHAVIHLTLLAVFADSLRAGREPLVTGVISRIRGPLPPELVAYGREVTIAWCVYFAAQVTVSVALFAWASLETWSLFVNALSYPLLIIMFAAEYAVRTVRFRHLPRSRLSDMLRVLVRWREPNLAAPPGGRDAQ